VSDSLPAIRFSGLATGLDTASLVSSMVAAERAPISTLQARRATAASRQALYKELAARASDLQTKAEALKKAVVVQKATSSDGARVRATATSAAAPGTHTLTVANRASATTLVSQGLASATATGALGAGTLRVVVGGVTKDIAVTAGADSLTQVRDAINASGAAVRASIVNDGSSAPNRLVITGTATGLASAVTVDASGLTGGATPLATTTLVAADDARFTLDNLAMTRGTNQVTDALEGVTLDLLDETAGEVVVEVASDGAASARPVQEFVTAFNSIAGFIRDRSKPGAKEVAAGPLLGDAAANGATRRLSAALGGALGPAAAPNLAAIGVTTARDGTLSIDAAKVAAKWVESPAAVTALVAEVGAKLADAAGGLDDPSAGVFATRATAIDRQLRDIDARIVRKEAAVARLEVQLTARFTALEKLTSNLKAQGSLISQLASGSSS
jgi:flagellar hook-associated protein 2